MNDYFLGLKTVHYPCQRNESIHIWHTNVQFTPLEHWLNDHHSGKEIIERCLLNPLKSDDGKCVCFMFYKVNVTIHSDEW